MRISAYNKLLPLRPFIFSNEDFSWNAFSILKIRSGMSSIARDLQGREYEGKTYTFKKVCVLRNTANVNIPNIIRSVFQKQYY